MHPLGHSEPPKLYIYWLTPSLSHYFYSKMNGLMTEDVCPKGWHLFCLNNRELKASTSSYPANCLDIHSNLEEYTSANEIIFN